MDNLGSLPSSTSENDGITIPGQVKSHDISYDQQNNLVIFDREVMTGIQPKSQNNHLDGNISILPGKEDEDYVNLWVQNHNLHENMYRNRTEIVQSPKNQASSIPIESSEKSRSHMCLEDHRLMIDQAIDKLKGELSQKDKDIIEPLVYRQKLMIEQQNQHNSCAASNRK